MSTGASASTANADGGGRKLVPKKSDEDLDQKVEQEGKKRRKAKAKGGSQKVKPVKNTVPSELLEVVLKALLHLQQGNRLHSSLLLDTWELKTDSVEYKYAKAQGELYSKKCQEEGTDHTNGPPFVWICAAVAKALLTRGIALGAENARKLAEFYERFEAATLEMKVEWVQFFQVSKMFDQNKKRLVMCIKNPEVRDVFCQCLKQTGAVLKLGKMPPGALERELQTWLEAVQAG